MITQLNSTQLNSTQLNSTQLNSTQLNSTQLNSTRHTKLNYNASTKKGFTLIELIFTIVIIGMLVAVAIPKFKNLQTNASYASAMKIYNDAKSSIPSAFLNAVDLNNRNVNQININELFYIKGGNYEIINNNEGYFIYNRTLAGKKALMAIILNAPNRTLHTKFYCSNLKDSNLVNKCKKELNVPKSKPYIVEKINL